MVSYGGGLGCLLRSVSKSDIFCLNPCMPVMGDVSGDGQGHLIKSPICIRYHYLFAYQPSLQHSSYQVRKIYIFSLAQICLTNFNLNFIFVYQIKIKMVQKLIPVTATFYIFTL